MIQFDLQLFGSLFGGGGGGTQVIETPVYQASAPSASAVSTESATDTEKNERRKKLAEARGRRATVTGAGMQGALSALSNIRSTFLDDKSNKLG